MSSPEEQANESIAEFLKMTPAQRIAAADQANAMIHEHVPQVEPVLAKGSEFTEALVDLIQEDPELALFVITATEAALNVIKASVIYRREQ